MKSRITKKKQVSNTNRPNTAKKGFGRLSASECRYYIAASGSKEQKYDLAKFAKISGIAYVTLSKAVEDGCGNLTAYRLRKAHAQLSVYNDAEWVPYESGRGWSREGGVAHTCYPRFIMWGQDACVRWVGSDRPKTLLTRYQLLFAAYRHYQRHLPMWFSVMDGPDRWEVYAHEPRCLVTPSGEWHWIDEPPGEPEELLHIMKGYRVCI